MTTDTAVRATRMVVQQKGNRCLIHLFIYKLTFPVSLNNITYLDYPELRIDEQESTEMPFRYVKDADGAPIMPKVNHN